MKLTESQRKVLLALDSEPVGPNYVGSIVWGKDNSTGYRGSNCSAPYARPAGRVLASLEKLGLVERVGEFLRWRRTTKGERVAKEVVSDS